MTSPSLVSIRIANPMLRDVIIDQLAAIGWSAAHDASVVLTTTTDCSVDECRALAQSGVRVIVLASTARPGMAEMYLAGGAGAYLPMRADSKALAATLQAAVLP